MIKLAIQYKLLDYAVDVFFQRVANAFIKTPKYTLREGDHISVLEERVYFEFDNSTRYIKYTDVIIASVSTDIDKGFTRIYLHSNNRVSIEYYDIYQDGSVSPVTSGFVHPGYFIYFHDIIRIVF